MASRGLIVLVLLGVLVCSGCLVLPEITHQPTLHNPFPQLSKVAVVPFFNMSSEPTVDGRQFAEAYFNELQLVPGFEVVPISVVERAMLDNDLRLADPQQARQLAQVLGVDAVVIGVVTDFSPYYPPRCTIQVEWYAANPCFHSIPPGYGLPWGTSEEEGIPGSLVFEAEFALAQAQLDTQTPDYEPAPPQPLQGMVPPKVLPGTHDTEHGLWIEESSHEEPAGGESAEVEGGPAGVPPNWPDPRGFIPPPPRAVPGECQPTERPVLRHTQTYNGHESDFTEALSTYYYFRDDARFGGWQNYLTRSDDFIRFCCHMHIWEMLGARGGAGETRVVWRWPDLR